MISRAVTTLPERPRMDSLAPWERGGVRVVRYLLSRAPHSNLLPQGEGAHPGATSSL